MAASRPLSTFAHLSTSIFPGCDLLPDLLTGRHRGFAFITFEVSLEPGALLPNSKTGLLKVITAAYSEIGLVTELTGRAGNR